MSEKVALMLSSALLKQNKTKKREKGQTRIKIFSDDYFNAICRIEIGAVFRSHRGDFGHLFQPETFA